MMIGQKNMYSNGIGDNLSGCLRAFPFDKEARRKCNEDFQAGKGDATELERIRLQNEALALQNASQNTGMSAFEIGGILVLGFTVITVAVVVIKKYAK